VFQNDERTIRISENFESGRIQDAIAFGFLILAYFTVPSEKV
jgi:hypothetical protein